MALFSAEWLAGTFGLDVVVTVRHPAAFASSLKRLNWQFPFHSWLDQPLLMRDHLHAFRPEIERLATEPRDIIDQAVLLWRCGNSFVRRLQVEHPDWTFLRCEDLSDDPVIVYRGVYQKLGLEFNDAVAGRVASYSDAANVKEVPSKEKGTVRRDSKAAKLTWTKRLTKAEIARIRQGVADVSPWFYSDAEWE